MTIVMYLLFVVAGYLITLFAHIQTKREYERYLEMRVSAMLREVEEVKRSCKRVDAMLVDY